MYKAYNAGDMNNNRTSVNHIVSILFQTGSARLLYNAQVGAGGSPWLIMWAWLVTHSFTFMHIIQRNKPYLNPNSDK